MLCSGVFVIDKNIAASTCCSPLTMDQSVMTLFEKRVSEGSIVGTIKLYFRL